MLELRPAPTPQGGDLQRMGVGTVEGCASGCAHCPSEQKRRAS